MNDRPYPSQPATEERQHPMHTPAVGALPRMNGRVTDAERMAKRVELIVAIADAKQALRDFYREWAATIPIKPGDVVEHCNIGIAHDGKQLLVETVEVYDPFSILSLDHVGVSARGPLLKKDGTPSKVNSTHSYLIDAAGNKRA